MTQVLEFQLLLPLLIAESVVRDGDSKVGGAEGRKARKSRIETRTALPCSSMDENDQPFRTRAAAVGGVGEEDIEVVPTMARGERRSRVVESEVGGVGHGEEGQCESWRKMKRGLLRSIEKIVGFSFLC